MRAGRGGHAPALARAVHGRQARSPGTKNLPRTLGGLANARAQKRQRDDRAKRRTGVERGLAGSQPHWHVGPNLCLVCRFASEAGARSHVWRAGLDGLAFVVAGTIAQIVGNLFSQ